MRAELPYTVPRLLTAKDRTIGEREACLYKGDQSYVHADDVQRKKRLHIY